MPPIRNVSDAHPTPTRIPPFSVRRPAQRRSWLDRLLRKPRPDLAAQAIEALLATTDASAISRTAVSALLVNYGLSGPEARLLLTSTWRRVLSGFLADDRLSDREVAYLDTLRNAFALTSTEVRQAEEQILHPRYAIALNSALADERLTPEEREALGRLAAHLRLPAEVEKKLFERSAEQLLDSILARAIGDRRLSPEEQRMLDAVARQLGVPIPVRNGTATTLERFALFWRIENEGPPSVPWPAPLADGESCHFHSHAARTNVRPALTAAAEGVGGVRIARGVYFRAGTLSAERLAPSSRLRQALTGRLIITNRHVHFEGDARRAIALRSIDSFHVHPDGIVVEPSAGPPAGFLIDGDVELAAVILGAALTRA